jgi:hypothetical protein
MEPISNLAQGCEGKLSGAGGVRPFRLAIYRRKIFGAKENNFSNQTLDVMLPRSGTTCQGGHVVSFQELL